MWELLCLLQPKATNAAHKQETKMMKQADKHMHQALIWGKVCLQASVRANILQQAVALVGTQAMASSMCLGLIAVLKSSETCEGLKQTKQQPFKITLKNFPRENVPERNLCIKELADQLDCLEGLQQ